MSESESRMKPLGQSLMVVLGFGLFVFGVSKCHDAMREEERNRPKLLAVVQVKNGQVVMTNLNDFAWRQVRIDINPEGLSSGYLLHVDKIDAGETLKVDAMQFAKSDGERLNLLTHKIVSVFVNCDTPKGATDAGFVFN